MNCVVAYDLRSPPTRYLQAPQSRRRSVKVRAVGEKIQDWLKSPAQIATFGARLTVGALLTTPERLSQLPSDLSKVQEVIIGSSSANEKANILLEEVELRVVDCLERGVTVESDVYKNLRSILPEQFKQSMPETSPLMPTKSEAPESDIAPAETYNSDTITREKITSETTGLTEAIIAVRTAQSALRTNISQSREKMLKMNLAEEREFLRNLLTEIDVGSTGMNELDKEAREVLTETESMI